MSELHAAYHQNYLTHGLPDEAVELVAQLATEEKFRMNDLIVRKGDTSGDLFLVLEGRVYVIASTGHQMNDITSGGVFGEVALIDAGPRSADVIARTDCLIARINCEALREKMWEHQQIGYVLLANLAKVLCARLRIASETIDALLDERVDLWSPEIGERNGEEIAPEAEQAEAGS